MSGKILWIDDEVDLLRPHIVFLENKGYIVTPVNNVNEALEIIEKEKFELTLLMKICLVYPDWKPFP